MDSPMLTATWRAAVLGAISNIFGQAIGCYQSNRPLNIDTLEVFIFTLFSIVLTPPNFAWQKWLESNFPGRTTPDATSKKASKTSGGEKQLNLRNTAIKFALDQTFGAAFNTVAFLVGIDLLKGRHLDVATQHCRERFAPMIAAGYKFWPAVSISSFVMVPVEYRTTFGSIVGLFWNIYLSLLSSGHA